MNKGTALHLTETRGLRRTLILRSLLLAGVFLALGQSLPLMAAVGITGLRVQGNIIVNSSSQTVTLHGINFSGGEYACIASGGYGFFDAPVDPPDQTIVGPMAAWGINAVRVPLNEGCWLNINGANPTYAGANYQNAVKNFVNLLVSNGLVPILEIHWSGNGTTTDNGQQPMLNRDHSITAWQQIATAFKGNSSVIFDLHNEPFPDNNNDTTEAWRCWRDGGTCRGMNYQAAGMQELVTAVRGTGAANIIMLGGVEYANNLSQWLVYKPTDSLNNLAASWHSYDFNYLITQTDWDNIIAPVAAQVPVVTGEMGDHEGSPCSTTYVNKLMPWMDSHGISYLGWNWNIWGDCLDLITNWNGAGSTWGLALKNHIATLASPDTTPPTVSITNPANNATVSGNITITGTASDNVGVAGVQFKIDGTNLGTEDTTSPYTKVFASTSVANGAHTITAVARDAAGNTTTSSVININVSNSGTDTTAPTVSIINPANNATISGNITITGTASDNVAVAGVQFKIDGTNLGTEDTTSPYTKVFASTTVANGAHTLTAVARDAAGNTSTSTAVNINVSNSVADTTAPTVSITNPPNNAVISAVTTVSGTASDNVGVVGVQFKVNGTNLGAEDTATPYAATLDPSSIPPASGKLGWSSGFYPGWLQLSVAPSALPWKGITHLIQFSFMTSTARNGSLDDGSAHSLTPALIQAAVSEAHKQGKKILISIGGAEDNNWDAACSATNRATFVNNVVNLVKTYGYDGVDLDIEQDWQSPTHTDYIACVAAVRNGLNTITPRPVLTEDGDPDWQAYMLAQVWQYLDQINLMSYWTDANGTATGLSNYTSVGVPKSLIGVGIGIDDGGFDGANPADCGAKAQYSITNGYGGVMEWTAPGDQMLHSGAAPCFDSLAPYISSANYLTAVARDAAGNTTTSAPVYFTVAGGTNKIPPAAPKGLRFR